MKPPFFFRVVAICAALASLGSLPINTAQPQTSRQVLDADSAWRFHKQIRLVQIKFHLMIVNGEH